MQRRFSCYRESKEEEDSTRGRCVGWGEMNEEKLLAIEQRDRKKGKRLKTKLKEKRRRR